MNLKNVIAESTDADLVAVIHARDRQSLPIADRVEGDDAALRDIAMRIEVKDLVVSMNLVAAEVMRELLARGVSVPRPNR